MANRRDRNLGDVITDVVEDVIGTGQFERLNTCITETLDAVFEELGLGDSGSVGAGDWAAGNRKSSYGEAAGKWAGSSGQSHSGTQQGAPRAPYERKSWSTVIQEALAARENRLYTNNPAGQVSGPLYTLIGGFMAGLFGLVAAFGLITTLAEPDPFGFLASGILIAMAAAGGILFKKGRDSKKRIKRFKAYVRVLGNRTYCNISELAAAVGESEEFVREDLRQMFDLKYFPKGRMDVLGTTLMLDDETYQQYLNANESFRQRQAEEEKARKAQEEKEQKEGKVRKEGKEESKEESKEDGIFSSGKESSELQAAIREGERYIRQIREANDAIPGEEITRKLDRLESLMKKIFTVLSQKPDQLPKLRKFMQYYMPTTDKLVQTYRQLDAQSVEGENITKAKKEIEDTLDTINDAYEKLLDNFFEEAAMDVSTDISVLQGLMAQEGLTGQPFGKK